MFSTQILLPILMTLCTIYFTASALPNTILFSCDAKVLRGDDGGEIVHTSTRKFKIRIQKTNVPGRVIYEEDVTRLYWTKTLKGIAAPYNPDTLDRATASIGIILYTKRDNKSTIFDNKVIGDLVIEINLAAEELKDLSRKDMSSRFKKLTTDSATVIINTDPTAWVTLKCEAHPNTLLDIKKNGEYKTASCKRVFGIQKLGWGFILV